MPRRGPDNFVYYVGAAFIAVVIGLIVYFIWTTDNEWFDWWVPLPVGGGVFLVLSGLIYSGKI